MKSGYHHVQIATVILAALAAAILLVAMIAFYTSLNPISFAVLALLAVVAVVFSTLSVTVDDRSVTWQFTFGFWKQRVDVGDIIRADPVTNKWWWGWGIHYTPRGWLYNVSGLQGVEIEMRDGRTFRVGTDEPERLAAAIGKTSGA